MSDTQTTWRTKLTDADRTDGDIWWTDLMTNDLAGATAFYTGLFGWSYFDAGEEFGHYHRALVGDDSIAGLMAAQPGAPTAWTPYVQVPSAVDAVSKAQGLGATVLAPAMQVGPLGWMAVFVDPAGATLGVWQPLEFGGSDLVNTPGALSWTQVETNDVAVAGDFYTALFGWTLETKDMGGTDYHLFTQDGHNVAGMVEGPSSSWRVTLAVANLDDALEWTRGNGGAVVVEPRQIPFGTFAAVRDPQGGLVDVIELSRG